MDLKKTFVLAAGAPGANVSELCREYGISRNNGYKWLSRYRAEGTGGLEPGVVAPRRPPGPMVRQSCA